MAKRGILAVCCLALLTLRAGAEEGATSPVVYGMTPERLAASVAMLVGLIGMVNGGWNLTRSRRIGNGPNGGMVALVAGLIGMALGGMIVATADGGVGTGHGLAGGVVAVVMGSISMVLGGLTRARSRRTG